MAMSSAVPSRNVRGSNRSSGATTTRTSAVRVGAASSFWKLTVNGKSCPAGTNPRVSAVNGPVSDAAPVAAPGAVRYFDRSSGPTCGFPSGVTPEIR